MRGGAARADHPRRLGLPDRHRPGRAVPAAGRRPRDRAAVPQARAPAGTRVLGQGMNPGPFGTIDRRPPRTVSCLYSPAIPVTVCPAGTSTDPYQGALNAPTPPSDLLIQYPPVTGSAASPAAR